MRARFMALDDLAHVPGNPKGHDLDLIVDSIRRFGFVAPILLQTGTNTVIAGNGRLDALRALRDQASLYDEDDPNADPPRGIELAEDGAWLVPVVEAADFANDDERDAYVVADNQATLTGGWDSALLAASLDRVAATPDGFTGTGFSTDMLAKLRKSIKPLEDDGRRGKDPEAKLPGYEAATILQIMLLFDSTEYNQMVDDLAWLRAAFQLPSNTDVVKKLVEDYVSAHRR